MFLKGCFGNRFKPRPLSRGPAWPAAKHVQCLQQEGGGPRRIALPPPDYATHRGGERAPTPGCPPSELVPAGTT
ncbi:hypothetical protein NDU88_001961 [Pleurodeles waltl]|uniref:Uncharacterized protein n=1 Tax=Pleurodeles waltl TaxID=8319 RepID=A0AAV7T0M1_PLEWA|nr:hypothetical protein NDU88_001961 [Pleurodeles waltl]